MNKVLLIFLILSANYANAITCNGKKIYNKHICPKKINKYVETKMLDTDPNLLNDGREPGGMLWDPYAHPRIWDPSWKVKPYIPDSKDSENSH